MIRNSLFTIKRINDRIFLLPYGQALVVHKKSYEFSELGLEIWELLKDDFTIEEVCGHFDESQKDDIEAFLEFLLRNSLAHYTNCNRINAAPKTYTIGGITLLVRDNSGLLADCLKDFESVSTDKKSQTFPTDVVSVYVDLRPMFAISMDFKKLVDTNELTIEENEAYFKATFKTLESVDDLLISKEGRHIYIKTSGENQEELMSALRLGYSYYALKAGKLLLHSASILYKDRLWLFSAPSKTGKSTQAKMWQEYAKSKIINGDLNMLTLHSSLAAEGTPWCGTSGRYDSKTYPVGGILFLERAPEARVEAIDDESQVLSLVKRSISPNWNSDLLDEVFALGEEISSKVFMARLLCTPGRESVDVLKSFIDGYLAD